MIPCPLKSGKMHMNDIKKSRSIIHIGKFRVMHFPVDLVKAGCETYKTEYCRQGRYKSLIVYFRKFFIIIAWYGSMQR